MNITLQGVQAMQKADKTNRRVTSTTTISRNGKVETEEWIYEYVLPDKIHYVHVQTSEGKTRRTEQIDIGKTKYCKKDDGAWEIPKGYCIGGSGNGGPSKVVSMKYTVEKTKMNGEKVSIFRWAIIYKDVYSQNGDTERLGLWEASYSINNDGYFLREETKDGLMYPETVSTKTIKEYTYDPNIKIEAPIQ